MQSFTFDIFADFYQFYIQDENADVEWSDSWTPEAISRMLAIAPGMVMIGTARNTTVPVTLEIHSLEPDLETIGWDRIVDCDLAVVSDRIVVAGCTDYLPDAARIAVATGHYRVRVSYAGLEELSEDGLDGKDRYRVQLWPGAPCGVRTVGYKSA
jgi:hypothetical protein